ncbi:MAG TPA: hypothetical protein VGA52_15415 [Anaerolineales bacterium]
MTQPDSRLGFHFNQPNPSYSKAELARWRAQLSEMQASWILLPAPTDQALPEAFVRGLLDCGLQPVVHIGCAIGSVRPAELNPLIYSYAHWGVHYVVVYDRPNMKSSWSGNGWSSQGLVDRFVDASLPALQACHSAGLRPVLPAPEPGGDYWDTAFLESSLKAIARRAGKDLVDSLVLGAYAYARGRPLAWGSGGPQAWPASRPYHTPAGAEDQQGAQIGAWYAQIAERVLGQSLPVLALGAGDGPSGSEDVQVDAEMGRSLRQAGWAPELMAAIFDRLPTADQRAGWFTQPKRPALAMEAHAKGAPDKVLDHYLLLPSAERYAVPVWRYASAFALTKRPVIGFSSEEAVLARHVSIAGDERGIPLEVDEQLRAAGCHVQRLSVLPASKSACRPDPYAEPCPDGQAN